jgi:multiple sugar transport system substrate-binding protein
MKLLFAGAVVALAVVAWLSWGLGDGTRITVVLFGDADEVAGYGELVERFEDEHPDITVDLAPAATQDELMAKLTTAFAGGQPPEVFLLNFRFYGQFAAQGAIDPVQPYLDASDVLDEDDYYPAPLDAFRFDGRNLTCMPQNLSSLVVYYNRDLFEQHGLEEPWEGWTWDDLLATAEALTDDDTYGLGMPPLLPRVAPFVWSNGGEMTDDDLEPTVLTLDDGGPAREALDWFLDLSTEHGVVPPDREELSEDAMSRFMRGGLGMYLNSRVAVPTLRNIDGFDWDVGPLPVAPGGDPVSILHSDAYCMSTGSDHPDEAWRFVEFAMGPVGQEILAASGRTVPSRRDVANADVFLEPDLPPSRSQVYLDAADHLRATPSTGAWARLEREANQVLEELYYGRIDRDEGVELLVEQSRELLSRPVGDVGGGATDG